MELYMINNFKITQKFRNARDSPEKKIQKKKTALPISLSAAQGKKGQPQASFRSKVSSFKEVFHKDIKKIEH